MKKFLSSRRWWIISLTAVLIPAVVYVKFFQKSNLHLTNEERQWLNDHPTIVVAPNPIFPPYEFYEPDGSYSGLSADLLQAVGSTLGVAITTVRIEGRDDRWQALRDGRVDLLGAVKQTAARQKDFLFSTPIADSKDVIITRSTIRNTLTIDSLIGLRVVIPKNNAVQEELKTNYPGIHIVAAGAGYETAYAVSFGDADAAILNLGAASYYIKRLGLSNLRVSGVYHEHAELSFGIAGDRPILKSIIEKALISIPAAERERITNKWLGLQNHTTLLDLIPWQWIAGILSIIVAVVLMVLSWNRSLQREVQSKTAAIRHELDERRKSEEALRESDDLLRQAEEVAMTGNWKWTLGEKSMYGSDGARIIYGFERNEIPLHDAQSVVLPEYRQLLDDALNALIEHASPYDIEFKICNRTNGKILSIYSKAVYNAESKTIFGVIQDITGRKQLEHQLIQAQKMDGLGTLAGGIAHDFNNLLAMILGSSELLRQHTGEKPELIKYVDRIIEAAERGSSISRQLLMFTRPDQVELKPISVSHIISEIRDMLKHFLPKTITIKTVMEVDNGIIWGEAGQIHQALLNLALNAGDAMTNTGTLTIKEFSVPPAIINQRFSVKTVVPYVGMSVTDTGVGMDEPMIAKIFDPFFTTKEGGKGTGLGLAMVHSIVKSHNGFIDVASSPGAGTTFTLYFPSVPPEGKERIAMEKPVEQRRSGTILLVDDEQTIRELLSEYLCDSGYTVHLASNGIEALDFFRTHPVAIDLIITDLGMPEMGGEELYKKLRQLDAAVKVMVSSGYLDGTTKDSLLELGICGVITKPYRFSAIGDEICKALEHR